MLFKGFFVLQVNVQAKCFMFWTLHNCFRLATLAKRLTGYHHNITENFPTAPRNVQHHCALLLAAVHIKSAQPAQH
jgi:hypothetical protein